MKLASMLRRLRNTQGGTRSTRSTPYTPYNPYMPEPPTDPCAPLPGETEPPWLTEARTYLGLREDTDQDRTKIEKLFEFGGFDINPDETSWCAAFVGSVLAKRGIGHTHSPGSQSYRTWGEPCEERVGAVVVFNGHVGFVSSPGMVLGGNQSDGVNIQPQSWYGTVLSYRCPSECSSPDEADESGETSE